MDNRKIEILKQLIEERYNFNLEVIYAKCK